MGYRISLYCVPKEIANKWKDITKSEEIKKFGELYSDLTKECMIHDTLNSVLRYSADDDKLCSRFFTNELEIESDMSFDTISKEQLLNIIEEVRVNHICKWFGERLIKDKDDLGEYWHKMQIPYDKALLANQGEWNIKGNEWKYKWKNEKYNDYAYYHINVHIDEKWQVTGGMNYEYGIFDLIHILKIFDFEKNIIMAIGG